VRAHTRGTENSTLVLLMLAYGAASLVHFVHNGIYLHEYPNLPAWLTSTGVYASWSAITAVGALGYWLYRRLAPVMGLVTIAIYAALGFGGLDHYVIAPIGAHSMVMNLTIFSEVVAAAALLIFVVFHALLTRQQGS
jgi:hypothetical protein